MSSRTKSWIAAARARLSKVASQLTVGAWLVLAGVVAVVIGIVGMHGPWWGSVVAGVAMVSAGVEIEVTK